jgi:hypothetical protein
MAEFSTLPGQTFSHYRILSKINEKGDVEKKKRVLRTKTYSSCGRMPIVIFR